MLLKELPLPVREQPSGHASNHRDEAASFNRRALFVGGCPKSGTTLLLSLLDGHPQLVALPVETHFLEDRVKYAPLAEDSAAKLKRLLARLDPLFLAGPSPENPREDRPRNAEADGGLDHRRFARLTRSYVARPGMNDSLLLSETVRAYMEATGGDWRGCARWVEKTPSNIAHADDLFQLFPEAKLIHLLRDPRAVFASRRQRLLNRYGSHAKAHRLVREWNESARQIPRQRERGGRHLVVRYEDLVTNSPGVMEQICRFTGIEFHPVLLQPTLGGQPWLGNPTFCGSFEGIDNEPAERWRTELTPAEIWWVEMHCREGMALAGYGLESDAKFSLRRWGKRLQGESWRGYLHARKSSLCQLAGLIQECRYDLPDGKNSRLPVQTPPFCLSATDSSRRLG
jgi:hypothetical protein